MQSFNTLQMPLRLPMGLSPIQDSSVKMAVFTRLAHVKQMAKISAVRMNQTLQE